MHGTHGREVLLYNRFCAASPRVNIPLQPADKTNICIAINKNLKVHQAAHPGVKENKNSFDNDHGQRIDANRLSFAGVHNKIIDGPIDTFSGAQPLQVAQHQSAVIRIRVIEINPLPLIQRQILQVAIVGILLQIDGVGLANGRDYLLRYGGFAGTRSTTDSYNHRLSHQHYAFLNSKSSSETSGM